jgi:L-seryl-tRNA(Ser) seleniumtransferase
VAVREIPVLAMLTLEPAALGARAAALRDAIGLPEATALVSGSSAVGGGSFPGAVLPTTLVALQPGASGAASLALRLRLGSPSVVARIEGGKVLLDPRTLSEESLPDVAGAVRAALASQS